MADVFLSYSSRDRSTASQIAELLAEEGHDVFWDRHILTGEDFIDRIETELEESRCTIVLWSADSVQSRWVHAEARRSEGTNKLIEVYLEDVAPPLPFGTGQACDLEGWSGDRTNAEFKKLISSVTTKARLRESVGTLPVPEVGEDVTDAHITLIHTARRCAPDVDEKYRGQEMFQFHVITFAHERVLKRVEKVTYLLDRTYKDSKYGTRRELGREYLPSCFSITDLAWGYSVVEADVKVSGQVKLVHLSRFINLYDGPPLKGAFFASRGSESWWLP